MNNHAAMELTKRVEETISQLDKLSDAFVHTTEHELNDLHLPQPEQRRRLRQYRQRMQARTDEAMTLWREANRVADQLAPVDPPEIPRDELERFEKLVELHQLEPQARIDALHAAVRAGDALTYDTILKGPGFLRLVPAEQVARAQREWAAKFSQHPSRIFLTLRDAAERLFASILRLKGQVEQPQPA